MDDGDEARAQEAPGEHLRCELRFTGWCGKGPAKAACMPTAWTDLLQCCMQRLRETVRSWAADQTIRDVSLLNEARRAIEFQMVRAPWPA